MTCIVGLIHKGKVYMGGDSAGVAGTDVQNRKDVKVFNNGPFVMGFTTSFRMGQLLQFSLKVEQKIKPRQDVMEYMVNVFIPAVQKCLKEGGWVSDGKQGGNFLVGFKGRLFEIQGDYQVAEVSEEYNAVGCGENYAKGSLYSNRHIKDPVERINDALKAAEHFSSGVRSPFTIVSE